MFNPTLLCAARGVNVLFDTTPFQVLIVFYLLPLCPSAFSRLVWVPVPPQCFSARAGVSYFSTGSSGRVRDAPVLGYHMAGSHESRRAGELDEKIYFFGGHQSSTVPTCTLSTALSLTHNYPPVTDKRSILCVFAYSVPHVDVHFMERSWHDAGLRLSSPVNKGLNDAYCLGVCIRFGIGQSRKRSPATPTNSSWGHSEPFSRVVYDFHIPTPER